MDIMSPNFVLLVRKDSKDALFPDGVGHEAL